MPKLTDQELKQAIREVKADLRVIRDPALRRTLAQKRRELEDEAIRRMPDEET